MAQVILDKVCKIYTGNVTAVSEFSLSIADGEFVVFVGPSGCGKSTTLRMIAGLEDISSGTVSIGSKVVNDVHPKDRDIAMVFQNYALYPHMSVYENMALALKIRKVPKPEIQNRVMAAARMLGLEQLLERKPGQLSGGQRQRVAVGRAIVREPKAFLFDEPLSNLDAKLRGSTRGEIKALHQRLKTTTVYVTHDQEEAMTLGDRIVVMSGGLIQQAAPPLEVYKRPVNRFVAGFVGIPTMNFLDGQLQSSAGQTAFVTSDGASLALPARHAAALGGRTGAAVLGIRPQQLSLARADVPGQQSISVMIEVTEPLGDAIDVTTRTTLGGKIMARVAADAQVSPGMRANFACDLAAAHVFEPGEFGRNLTL
jgi:multiple sugar transport system ATP-binding protein